MISTIKLIEYELKNLILAERVGSTNNMLVALAKIEREAKQMREYFDRRSKS